ncbi:SCO5918 family protein [Streptomyces sp. NPDC006422]|uniref:SCO5918 family protein n=1 Tax=unclassified Streptomyces TaxID=2593676 RepID=UPI0033B549AC
MRCVIARFPFDLTKSGVMESMKGIRPEPVTGGFVVIGRRHYPAMQVGQVITGQDRRDFNAGEVLRAMTRLGFTCRTTPSTPPSTEPSGTTTEYERAAALLGPSPA